MGAGSYEQKRFNAPADSSHATVRGSFFEAGSNDIHVMILDGEGFSKWQDRIAPATIYYSSSQTFAADLEADVPTGEPLYLIIDNTYEATSDKIISADIELAYLR